MRRFRQGQDHLRSGHPTHSHERRSAVWLILSVVLAFSAIMLTFFGGEYVQRYIKYRKERQPSVYPSRPIPYEALRHIVLHTLYELPLASRARKLLDSGLPVYDLRIGRNNLRQLQKTAEAVLAKGFSTDVQREFFRAEFRADSHWLPVQVKARGVTAYHYLKKRPSLRVRFPKDRYFRRKREINLLEPYDKGLTADLTSNWELEHQGLLTWDSQFVILRINGEMVGLFQEIEQFGESIPARHRRSEGYIFSGAGQLFGKEGADFDKANRAVDLVRQCVADEAGEVGPHCRDSSFVRDYFDLDRWARAAAMTALLNSRHAWAPDNLRMFWDPARGKFEPIPWDYLYYRIDAASQLEGEADHSGYLSESLLRIGEFRRLRDRRLWSLLTHRVERMIEHADDLFGGLSEALRHDVRHLSFQSDIEKHHEYIDTLRTNSEILIEHFRRHDLRAQYWQSGDGELAVELVNRGKSFLVLDSLVFAVSGTQVRQSLEFPVEVEGLWEGRPGRVTLRVKVLPGAQLVGLGAQNGVTSARLAEDEISVSRAPSVVVPNPSPRPVPVPTISLPNVKVERSRVVFGPGPVEMEGTITVPESHEVVFQAGLDLKMGEGAVLLVYGDLTSIGSDVAPIRVAGIRPGVEWGGILVQGTRTQPARVQLRHTFIEGGSGGESERIRFSSPFSVHDGIVVMESCTFVDSNAEDGINLKYASVHLEDNLFSGSRSDGLDCDFCKGRIVDNRFADIGGDAVDFSGSEVAVEGNRIERCADKGLSIGEQTAAVVTGNSIEDCHTGIAVKDLSSVAVSDVRLKNLQVGLSLYVKKPTFGPSVVSVEKLQMSEVSSEFFTDSTCLLAIH